MTQELADKIIEGYEKIIKEVEGMDDVRAIQNLLLKRCANTGICNYAFKIIGEDLYRDAWCRVKSRNDGYWGAEPEDCATKPGILEALQLRVDILKTFKEI